MSVRCETTKISNLVDDCLFEIYKHLDLVDLASIADVCQRLRATSKIFLVQSRFEVLEYPSMIYTKRQVIDDPIDQLLPRTAKVLRNFGAFVTNFDESFNTSYHLTWRMTGCGLCEFSTKIVELLQNYCSESLIVLKFHYLGFTNKMANIRKPIFPRLQIFEWGNFRGRWRVRMERNALLSIWLPEVRELSIGRFNLVRRATMRTHFEHLTKATLRDGWHNESVGRLLMRNPQLKELHLFDGVDVTDFRVLEYVGKYTKDIEVVRLTNIQINDDLEYPTTFNYFTDLRELKCFEMRDVHCRYPKGALLVRSIVSAGIPLKSLTIEAIGTGYKSSFLLLEHILQLKSLEALDLGQRLESKGDIIRICTQLDKLRELRVGYYCVCVLDTADVLQLVQVGTKLQFLHLQGRIVIDDNIHEQLKKVIEKRSENSQFVLRIAEPRPVAEIDEIKIDELNLSSEWHPQLGLELHLCGITCIREWELVVCAHTNVGTGRCPRQHEDMTEFPIRFKNKGLRERIDKIRRVYNQPLLDQSPGGISLDAFK